MNIVEQLSGAAGKFQEQVRGYRENAVEQVRTRVKQAAEVVAASRTPVGTLAQATQRLNDLAHDSVAKLLSQQASTIDGLIGDGVERLKRLAQAEDLKSFVRKQVELNPVVRQRVVRDFQELWSIAARTGRDIGTLASDTYAELIYGVKTSPKRAAAHKTTRKTARKTARAKKAS